MTTRNSLSVCFAVPCRGLKTNASLCLRYTKLTAQPDKNTRLHSNHCAHTIRTQSNTNWYRIEYTRAMDWSHRTRNEPKKYQSNHFVLSIHLFLLRCVFTSTQTNRIKSTRSLWEGKTQRNKLIIIICHVWTVCISTLIDNQRIGLPRGRNSVEETNQGKKGFDRDANEIWNASIGDPEENLKLVSSAEKRCFWSARCRAKL